MFDSRRTEINARNVLRSKAEFEQQARAPAYSAPNIQHSCFLQRTRQSLERSGRLHGVVLRKKVLKHPESSVPDDVEAELHKLVLKIDQGLFVPPPVAAL